MTVATLVISFFPSSELDAQSNMVYQLTLGIAFVISVAIPFVIYANRHRWDTTTTAGVSGAVAGSAGGTGAKRAAVTAAVPSNPASANPLAGASPQDAFEHPAGCDGQQALAQPGRRLGRTASERSERAYARRDGLGQLHGCRGKRDQAPRLALAGRGRAEGRMRAARTFPRRTALRAHLSVAAGAGTTGTRDAEARERAAYEAEAAHRAAPGRRTEAC